MQSPRLSPPQEGAWWKDEINSPLFPTGSKFTENLDLQPSLEDLEKLNAFASTSHLIQAYRDIYGHPEPIDVHLGSAPLPATENPTASQRPTPNNERLVPHPRRTPPKSPSGGGGGGGWIRPRLSIRTQSASVLPSSHSPAPPPSARVLVRNRRRSVNHVESRGFVEERPDIVIKELASKSKRPQLASAPSFASFTSTGDPFDLLSQSPPSDLPPAQINSPTNRRKSWAFPFSSPPPTPTAVANPSLPPTMAPSTLAKPFLLRSNSVNVVSTTGKPWFLRWRQKKSLESSALNELTSREWDWDGVIEEDAVSSDREEGVRRSSFEVLHRGKGPRPQLIRAQTAIDIGSGSPLFNGALGSQALLSSQLNQISEHQETQDQMVTTSHNSNTSSDSTVVTPTTSIHSHSPHANRPATKRASTIEFVKVQIAPSPRGRCSSSTSLLTSSRPATPPLSPATTTLPLHPDSPPRHSSPPLLPFRARAMYFADHQQSTASPESFNVPITLRSPPSVAALQTPPSPCAPETFDRHVSSDTSSSPSSSPSSNLHDDDYSSSSRGLPEKESHGLGSLSIEEDDGNRKLSRVNRLVSPPLLPFGTKVITGFRVASEDSSDGESPVLRREEDRDSGVW